jgi:hypothetical protein
VGMTCRVHWRARSSPTRRNRCEALPLDDVAAKVSVPTAPPISSTLGGCADRLRREVFPQCKERVAVVLGSGIACGTGDSVRGHSGAGDVGEREKSSDRGFKWPVDQVPSLCLRETGNLGQRLSAPRVKPRGPLPENAFVLSSSRRAWADGAALV